MKRGPIDGVKEIRDTCGTQARPDGLRRCTGWKEFVQFFLREDLWFQPHILRVLHGDETFPRSNFIDQRRN